MSDAAAQQPKKRTFKIFEFRGKKLEDLTAMPEEEFVKMCDSRVRRSFERAQKRIKDKRLTEKLLKAKKQCKDGEKPKLVKTHCRCKLILPKMVGSVCGVYNGKTFTTVEIKPEMLGHYLGEFAMTYKPVMHGRPGVGATHSSKFVPLK